MLSEYDILNSNSTSNRHLSSTLTKMRPFTFACFNGNIPTGCFCYQLAGVKGTLHIELVLGNILGSLNKYLEMCIREFLLKLHTRNKQNLLYHYHTPYHRVRELLSGGQCKGRAKSQSCPTEYKIKRTRLQMGRERWIRQEA